MILVKYFHDLNFHIELSILRQQQRHHQSRNRWSHFTLKIRKWSRFSANNDGSFRLCVESWPIVEAPNEHGQQESKQAQQGQCINPVAADNERSSKWLDWSPNHDPVPWQVQDCDVQVLHSRRTLSFRHRVQLRTRQIPAKAARLGQEPNSQRGDHGVRSLELTGCGNTPVANPAFVCVALWRKQPGGRSA